MVLPPDQYQEEELNVPCNHFQSAGYQVQLASKGVKTATGMDGEKTKVDLDLDEVNLSEYIAVVFVGGEGSTRMSCIKIQATRILLDQP